MGNLGVSQTDSVNLKKEYVVQSDGKVIKYTQNYCPKGHMVTYDAKIEEGARLPFSSIFDSKCGRYVRGYDIDDNNIIDKFEIIVYSLMQTNKFKTKEECYRAALKVLNELPIDEKSKTELTNKYIKYLPEGKEIKEVKEVKEDSSFKKHLSSFLKEDWSGRQIAKLTGNNIFTDWLQNKDKVCTDGKDDGKLNISDITKSVVKGLVGGIPKMIINHPLSTAIFGGATAALVGITGGAILPVLGTAGLVVAAGMTGYGLYKAATAKTDGEAKQALETFGTGVTTTALTAMSAGKVLEKAAEAGVKSAQIGEDANIFQKTVQMIKSVPEALTKSKEWSLSYINSTPVSIELADGTVQTKIKGKLIDETFSNGGYKKYDTEGTVTEELIVNGKSKVLYKNGNIYEGTITKDGKVLVYKKGVLMSESYSTDDATITHYLREYNGVKGDFTKTTLKDGTTTVFNNSTNKIYNGDIIEGNVTWTYKKGDLVGYKDPQKQFRLSHGYVVEETLPNGSKIHYNYYSGSNGHSRKGVYPDGKVVEDFYQEYNGLKGYFTKTTHPDGTYKVVNNSTNAILEETIIKDGKTLSYENGILMSESCSENGVTTTHYLREYNGAEGEYTKIMQPNGSYKVFYDKTNAVVDACIVVTERTPYQGSTYSISEIMEAETCARLHGGVEQFVREVTAMDNYGLFVPEEVMHHMEVLREHYGL